MTPAPVAIVGGGAAGTLLALHLVRRHGIPVTLYDGSGAFGRGLAYSATSPWHRLNVPAVKMGGWQADDPDAFSRWLAARDGATPASAAGRYAARADYGEWLSGLLAETVAQGGARLERVNAVALAPDAGAGWQLHLADGRRQACQAVALCQGNAAPRALPGTSGHPRCINHPWQSRALAGVDADDHVLIAGSGASGLDSVLELLHTGHRGPIHLISRRALLPRPDALPEPGTELGDPLAGLAATTPATLRVLFRTVRASLQQTWLAGQSWQPLMDAVLRQADARWDGLTLADRRRFLRHVRAYWMVFRHRADPAALRRLHSAEAQGQLRRVAARVDMLTARAGGLRVELRHAGRGLPALDVDWVVNATGPDERVARRADPLLTQLLRDGLARPGPLGLGLDVTAAGAVRDAAGDVGGGLYALGLPTRGTFWEVTSVPALRARAAPLAALLADRVGAANGRARRPTA